jgi:hypothetical protein
MPTTECKARKLLKAKKAEVYYKRPFTIKLLYKTGSTTQPITVGIDTGSQHIGIAAVSEGKVLAKMEVELRTSMEKRSLMETRKTYRRNRRYRKVRFRHPKFRHHTKRVYSGKKVTRKSTKHKTHWEIIKATFTAGRSPGWLPPSIQSKVDITKDWINRIMDVLPKGTKLCIEVGRFDAARMKDPTIHGEMYQQGPQYDFENVKAYIFSRDKYTCKCCGKRASSKREDGTTVKLVAHHILFKSKSATDNPEYMISVCTACHTGTAHQPGGILYDWMMAEKKVAKQYQDTVVMNVLRKRLFAAYPKARFTYGNITAADRKKLLLGKTHANDAVAIAAHDLNSIVDAKETTYYRQVRKKKRSLHEANPRKGRKEPNRMALRSSKNSKCSADWSIFLWDKVLFQGKPYWDSGFADHDKYAYLKDSEDQYYKTGDEASKVAVNKLLYLHHTNGWLQYI